MKTPRTDAQEWNDGLHGRDDTMVPAEFARTMETELNTALARVAEIEATIRKLRDGIDKTVPMLRSAVHDAWWEGWEDHETSGHVYGDHSWEKSRAKRVSEGWE